jgi:hypothetical protein
MIPATSIRDVTPATAIPTPRFGAPAIGMFALSPCTTPPPVVAANPFPEGKIPGSGVVVPYPPAGEGIGVRGPAGFGVCPSTAFS